MEKGVRLKICSGDKRKFGDDITNLGPLIPLKSPEVTNSGTSIIEPFKNPSVSDENEEPVRKKAKKSKNCFGHEKFHLVAAMKSLR